MLSDEHNLEVLDGYILRLNAPFGAQCFLTGTAEIPEWRLDFHRLNAPFGARCFLTWYLHGQPVPDLVCLNAPFGARCFLTDHNGKVESS